MCLTYTPRVNNISCMIYDINTLDELIDALDGPSRASGQFDELSPQAVCNWRAKGFVPPSRHLQVILVMRRLGKTINPKICDCTDEDWALLGMMPNGPEPHGEAVA